jgi:hypothetical protein
MIRKLIQTDAQRKSALTRLSTPPQKKKRVFSEHRKKTARIIPVEWRVEKAFLTEGGQVQTSASTAFPIFNKSV